MINDEARLLNLVRNLREKWGNLKIYPTNDISKTEKFKIARQLAELDQISADIRELSLELLKNPDLTEQQLNALTKALNAATTAGEFSLKCLE